LLRKDIKHVVAERLLEENVGAAEDSGTPNALAKFYGNMNERLTACAPVSHPSRLY